MLQYTIELEHLYVVNDVNNHVQLNRCRRLLKTCTNPELAEWYAELVGKYSGLIFANRDAAYNLCF